MFLQVKKGSKTGQKVAKKMTSPKKNTYRIYSDK